MNENALLGRTTLQVMPKTILETVKCHNALALQTMSRDVGQCFIFQCFIFQLMLENSDNK